MTSMPAAWKPKLPQGQKFFQDFAILFTDTFKGKEQNIHCQAFAENSPFNQAQVTNNCAHPFTVSDNT